MRIIDAVLGRSNRNRRDDPVFGSMLYMGDRVEYWEGKATFVPTSSEIEVFVHGAKDDDMKDQHEFFKQVERDWPHLSQVIEQAVESERQKFETVGHGSSVWQKAQVSSLTIPRGKYEAAEWAVTVEYAAEPERLWMVRMKGSRPQLVTMDD